MKWRADEIRECGSCGRWTAQGNETPIDNFVCDRCQGEARILREVGAGCDRQNRGREAA